MIYNAIELAEKETDFRDIFKLCIAGWADTCGDKVTLSILYLRLNFKIYKAKKALNFKEVAHLLWHGTYVLDQLQKRAYIKEQSLHGVDPIEIYLGYPVILKKDLDIPIDIDSMLYFACSGITKDDLDEAKKDLQTKLSNKEECYRFISEQAVWIEMLKTKEEYKVIEEKRDQDAEDPQKSARAFTIYKASLLKLTREILEPL